MQETIGKRIARLRQGNGWTQQALSARLAISRVAVSHIEMDLTIPSERTITLIAGLFKIAPHALVEETTYPRAKAERLPEVACCYTTVEMALALLENDLAWLDRLGQSSQNGAAIELRTRWVTCLAELAGQVIDEREKVLLERAREKLAIVGQA
jgi:transcriptional regulator with XRE-family HTH domain